jgi:hypothetical protein
MRSGSRRGKIGLPAVLADHAPGRRSASCGMCLLMLFLAGVPPSRHRARRP